MVSQIESFPWVSWRAGEEGCAKARGMRLMRLLRFAAKRTLRAIAPIGAQFKPGDAVPHSGIYRVTHDPTHAQEHESRSFIADAMVTIG